LTELESQILNPSWTMNRTTELLMSMNEPVRVVTYEPKENNAISIIIKHENFNSNNPDLF